MVKLKHSFTSWWFFPPIWKICSSNWKSSSPSFRVKIKDMWNHHLVWLQIPRISWFFVPRVELKPTWTPQNHLDPPGNSCAGVGVVAFRQDDRSPENTQTKRCWSRSGCALTIYKWCCFKKIIHNYTDCGAKNDKDWGKMVAPEYFRNNIANHKGWSFGGVLISGGDRP